MRLFLVRHGETTYNRMDRVQGRLDTPLSPMGIEQAEDLSDALDETFDAVYSSTLQRTYHTARILAPDHRVTPHPGLAGIDMGTATGMPKRELHARLVQAAERDVLWRPPHGEHPERFQDRVVATLDTITDRHTGNVLVVTHRGVIQAYRSQLTGEAFAEGHRWSLPNGGVTVADPVNGVAQDNVY